MPDTAEKIFAQLNTKEIPFDELGTGRVSGTKVTETPGDLFCASGYRRSYEESGKNFIRRKRKVKQPQAKKA